MIAVDKETGTRFDDWVYNDKGEDYDTDTWSQVCDKCAKKFHLLDSYLAEGEAPEGTICGIEGCNNEADHYYDFNRE